MTEETHHKPIFVSSLIDALKDPTFLQEAAKVNFSFVSTKPEEFELSIAASEALRFVQKLSSPKGNPNPKEGRDSYKQKADEFAFSLKEIINELEISGYKTLQEIADQLTSMGIKTLTDKGTWRVGTVKNIKDRLKKFES